MQIQTPAKPASLSHAPVVSLMKGTLHGRPVVWAQMTGAAYGDRVWLDVTTDQGATWTQCGPFPVTTESGVSRSHPMGKHVMFRACADTPRAPRGQLRHACTEYW